ncbi:YcaO-like family protein [Rhizobium ruizarguesonis]
MTSGARAVVFLGPSLRQADARRILSADYRPPVKRGNLDDLPSGAVVGIIDGVFEQDLAVSPAEVRRAVERGLAVFGGSSMGALRAAEVPGVAGIGHVYSWYRDGVISRDDEVALLFDPVRHQPLTVPTVNVRYATDRLLRAGTIEREIAEMIVRSAERMSFKDRTYRRILAAAGLLDRPDSNDLIAMLSAHDIKANDAQDVLEAIDHYLSRTSGKPAASPTSRASKTSLSQPEAKSHSDILIWETGDCVTFEDLLAFIALTGRTFVPRATRDLVDVGHVGTSLQQMAQRHFVAVAKRWGWMSSEEADVTLSDLNIDRADLALACEARAVTELERQAAFASPHGAHGAAIRAELLLDDMALKRDVMRAAALRWFCERAPSPPEERDLAQARAKLQHIFGVERFSEVTAALAGSGFSREKVADFVRDLARARLAGAALLERMTGRASVALRCKDAGLGLDPCPKPDGEPRFCLDLATATRHCQRIADEIGITRIGLIGELGDLGGLQIAQAARPGNAWSSSYGSGKSRCREGAIIGAVMEECEKWAQECFIPIEAKEGGFSEIREIIEAVDPASLDLPHDSVYHPDLRLTWTPVADLVTGSTVLMPQDPLILRRGPHDICYSARGGRKHLATNGLGAGFSMTEAVLHGLCEFVERHAQRIAELYLSNPGGLGVQPYQFVEARGVAPRIDEILAALAPRADAIRVLDITGEIAIPTYMATIVRQGQVAQGFGTHPSPHVALESALLEAAQTIASAIAGGREDLSIKARSLGRHERPRPANPANVWFWLDSDVPLRPIPAVFGVACGDVLEDLRWSLDRVAAAGLERVLVCDLSQPQIAPAHVVRVIIPGLETNNPFYIGPRARLALLRNLLPHFL